MFHAVLYARDPDETRFGYTYRRFQRMNCSMRFETITGQGHWLLPDEPPCTPSSRFVRDLPLIATEADDGG